MKERVTAKISVERIRRNYEHIKSLVGESRVMAVVKADAYGHGAARVGSELFDCGCRDFAVACISEAQSLAEHVKGANLLILSPTDVSLADEIISGDFIQAVDSLEYAKALAAKGEVRVHVKVDTGMSRIGIYCHRDGDVVPAADEIEAISKIPGVTIEGIFTHFADSDGEGDSFTRSQFSVFKTLTEELDRRGVKYGVRHCCNSAATIKYPEMHLDMVRAGIILYGLMPSPFVRDGAILPAMKLSARVCAVHELKAGDCVSYGCTYTAKEDTKVAVISIGYADGFSRVYSGVPAITVNGRKYATVGKICMDLCMIDVGKDGVCSVGDEAVIFDSAEDIEALAKAMGTINYEILCSLRKRVLLEYI